MPSTLLVKGMTCGGSIPLRRRSRRQGKRQHKEDYRCIFVFWTHGTSPGSTEHSILPPIPGSSIPCPMKTARSLWITLQPFCCRARTTSCSAFPTWSLQDMVREGYQKERYGRASGPDGPSITSGRRFSRAAPGLRDPVPGSHR